MKKIRKNDEIVVLVGKDKGRRGVIQGYVGDNYVIVNGVNVAKKAVKPNVGMGVVGGIVEKSMPIHVSNVALVNPANDKAARVGFGVVDGKKVRVFKSNGEVVKV